MKKKIFKISAKLELSSRKSFFLHSRWVCLHHQHEIWEKVDLHLFQESCALRIAIQVMKKKGEVCEWWRNILKLVLFSDEACFHFSGCVASQHNNYQSVEKNLTLINEVPLHDIKVGVWCATSATRIICCHFSFWDHTDIFWTPVLL